MADRMIIVKINGGLGNQMFQYAIAKAIAQKNGDLFKLDVSIYPKQKLRSYELNFFEIEENIASRQEVRSLKGCDSLIAKIVRKMRIIERPSSYYAEKEICAFDSNVYNYNNIYLDGYWQNERYFKEIKFDLQNQFSYRKKLSIDSLNLLKQIQNVDSVSLHVRRGDYVENNHTNSIHGTCHISYYKKATEYISERVVYAKYFIFSDDIDWCKSQFDFLDSKVFVDSTLNALEDLELMRNCNHNIIANSTFSWWGAWLNTHKNKIVIAPKNWFSDSSIREKTKDLIPDRWLKI